MRKRLLSFVLAVLMIVCLFPVQQASAYSDAYSLPSLTGNQAADTANIAKSQLGYTYDGGTVYGAWWNGVTNWGVDYTQAGWCAIFVCWCANKAGAGLGIAYDKNGASPGYLFDWLKNNARYDTSFSTAPQAGDFIFFGNSSGGVEHVAVVTGYDASAGRVYLVGGNQGNGVGAVTSSSCRWASGSTWGSQYILGYGRPNYGGGTVTPDPDPGLSVKETITCKRTIKLPERVVNLYSNPTDTTRLTYFDYGPTVYSSRYAVMSDGSIMYEVGATNHQGQDIKVWLKYESDMTVTKQHTYGSTQYESAHPHRGYRVCECGDKTYTGETTTRDDCSECGGEVKYAVEGGYLTFDKKTGTVTDCDQSVTKANIPHTIKGVTVTCIGNDAFDNCRSLTSVTIPDSVMSIGDSAFRYCTSLTSVTIPDSVTSIGDTAFQYCTSLASVTIPDSVTSIGDCAFMDCSSLTSVTIPDSVTSIGSGAFSNCAALTGIWVTEGNSHYSSDASGVLFSKDKTTLVQCPGTLAACTIPDSVTSIVGYAFDGCTSLTSVTIPDSVTSIGGRAFDGCTSLTSVTIPDSVTSIGKGAFYDCTSLTSVTIPDSVTSIDEYAFYDCKSLTSVTIPDSVTSIGDWAFSGCKSLTNVYFTGTEEAWNGITIDDGNDALKNANIHYNYVSHTHSYKAVVTAPTCTEKGYTTHTCSCGDSYVDTYTDALGHAWDNGKVTKEPTATETGVRTYTCTRCSATKTETIPATGSVDVTQMFTDVTKNWAYPGIQYCVTHGIMGGMGDGTFAPTGTTTRAQIVQILYNLEGTPAVSGTTPFTDLTANWYKPAILWAYQNNVVAGTSPTTFDPERPVTREQIAVILTQYMFHVLKMNRTWTPADLSKFPDGAQVSSWAKEAMQDAVALGLINGTKTPDGLVYLDPQGSAARQQVATILMNFCQNVKK